MRVTVAAIDAPIGHFKLKIRDPGVVRHVAFEKRPKLVMAMGATQFEEIVILFLEAGEGQPIREHEFVVIEHGGAVDPDDNLRAMWRGTGIAGSGKTFHVFELVAAR